MLVIMASNRFRIVLSQLIITSIGLFLVYTFLTRQERPQFSPNVTESGPELIALKAFKLLSADSNYPSNVNQLRQDNPVLIKYAYYRHLTPPSKEHYNLPGPSHARFQNSFSFAVDKIFKGKVGHSCTQLQFVI